LPALLIEELADYILTTKYDAFSDEVIEAAKKRLIDIVGCAIGGANASGNRALLKVIKGWGGNKEATVLAHGDKVPLPNAAMINCVMVRSFDFEAVGPEAEGENKGRFVGHGCSTTDATALSVAEYTESSGKDLLTAMILGGDLLARIAIADERQVGSGYEPCGTINPWGATAIAGRLLGLTRVQMVNAFGIMVNQLAGSFQVVWDGANSFKLLGGLAARNGVFSAELAHQGFTDMKDPLLGPRGYFDIFCKGYHPEYVTRELGKIFYAKGQHKFVPSCFANHPALETSLEMVKNDFNADDISEVKLILYSGSEKKFNNQPFTAKSSQGDALFNYFYAVANVLLRKSVQLQHYTEEYYRDSKVLDLVRKIELVPTFQNMQECQLDVIMKDGKIYSVHRNEPPKGNLKRPLSLDEVKDKFRQNVAFSKTVPQSKAEKALELLDNIEKVDNVKKVIKNLVS
jgi:2-methylcitrate dehydratase PrpD